jgi:hypothetical protein
MVNLRWDGDDFNNSQDSSGTTADLVSHSGKLQQGYQHGSLTRGLVAYYPMEKAEGEILHDGALNNLGQIKSGSNGTTDAANMWASGKVGNHGLAFDGIDDHVKLPDIGLNKSESFTISAWVNLSDTPEESETVIGRYDGSDDIFRLIYNGGGSDKWRWQAGHIGGNIHDIRSVVASADTWYHLVVTFDPSGPTSKLYIDGTQERSETSSIDNFTSSNGLWIGGRNDDNHYLNGQIDDVRIYNRTLSEPEIKALYNEGNGVQSGVLKKEKRVPGQDQGGVSRYKLNGNADDAWSENNGSNNGADLTATGIYNQAAKFNGTSDYISVSNSSSLETDYLTATAWIYADSFGYNPRVAFKRQGGSEWGVAVDTENYSGNPLIINMWIDGNLEQLITNNTYDLPTGVWKFITITYDGSHIRLFVDSKLIDTKQINGTIDNEEGDLILGRGDSSWANPGYWNGKIDDVRIYDRALKPQQVEKLYHKGAYRIPRESTLQ